MVHMIWTINERNSNFWINHNNEKQSDECQMCSNSLAFERNEWNLLSGFFPERIRTNKRLHSTSSKYSLFKSKIPKNFILFITYSLFNNITSHLDFELNITWIKSWILIGQAIPRISSHVQNWRFLYPR